MSDTWPGGHSVSSSRGSFFPFCLRLPLMWFKRPELRFRQEDMLRFPDWVDHRDEIGDMHLRKQVYSFVGLRFLRLTSKTPLLFVLIPVIQRPCSCHRLIGYWLKYPIRRPIKHLSTIETMKKFFPLHGSVSSTIDQLCFPGQNPEQRDV